MAAHARKSGSARRWAPLGVGLLLLGSGGAVALVAAENEPAPSGEIAVSVPLIDEPTAMERARALDREVEATLRTGERTKIVAQPNGRFRAELSVAPVRVKRDDTWIGVDPDLEVGKDGRIAPKVAHTDLSLSAGGDRSLVSFGGADERISLSWAADLPAPTVEGAFATYPEVYPGTDLVVESGVTGFATYLVVKNRSAANNPALEEVDFGLAGDGLNVDRHADGSITAADALGNARFHSAAPRMWDATGATASQIAQDQRKILDEPHKAREGVVGTELAASKMTLKPDLSVLRGANTVFPVVIDPVWSSRTDEEIATAMVWSNGLNFYDSSTEEARVGNDNWSSTPKKARTFYRFDTSYLTGKHLHSATFRHHQLHSPGWSCDTTSVAVDVWRTGGIDGSTSWPGPSLVEKQSSNTKAHGHRDVCSGYDINEWDVMKAMQWAQSADSTRVTLGMVSANESDGNGWRQFRALSNTWEIPQLTVEYNTPPEQPATPTLVDATLDAGTYYENTKSPRVRATVVDADGDLMDVKFQIGQDTTTLWNWTSSSKAASGQAKETTVPTGILTADGTYWLRAQAVDDLFSSAWSAKRTFVIDTVAPATPTITLPTTEVGFGAGAKFTFVSEDPTVRAYKYGFVTSVPGPAVPVANGGDDLTITYSPKTFGPSWVLVQASDLAGNLSGVAEEGFRVKGAEATHRWKLDGGGADSTGAASLSVTSGTPWVEGHDRNYNGLGTSELWAPSDDAAQFDGAGRAASTATEVIDTSRSFSVSAWVKLDGGTDQYPAVAAQEGTTSSAFQLGFFNSAWGFQVRSADSTTASVARVTGPTVTRPTGWTHLIGVYVGGRTAPERRVDLYIDGKLAGSQAAPDGAFKGAGRFTVGRGQTSGASSNYFPGVIDEVRAFPGPIDPVGALTLAHEVRDQEDQ